MKALKIIAYVLFVIQIIALFGMAMSNSLFTGSFANLIGKFLFGIVGAVLFAIAAKKEG